MAVAVAAPESIVPSLVVHAKVKLLTPLLSVALAVRSAVVAVMDNIVVVELILSPLGAGLSSVITWVSVTEHPLSGSVIVTV